MSILGMHYWYNFSANLECKDIFPMFLLYDVTSRKLMSFGWAVPVRVPSATWEHPPSYYFKVIHIIFTHYKLFFLNHRVKNSLPFIIRH